LTWEHARQMARDGFKFGSHGISHRDLRRMKREEQLHELEFSKKQIEKNTGCPVSCFALPYGLYNAETTLLVKQAGYIAACTTDIKLNEPAGDFLIHRWNVKR